MWVLQVSLLIQLRRFVSFPLMHQFSFHFLIKAWLKLRKHFEDPSLESLEPLT